MHTLKSGPAGWWLGGAVKRDQLIYRLDQWPPIIQPCRRHASVVIGHSRQLDGAPPVKRDDVTSGRA